MDNKNLTFQCCNPNASNECKKVMAFLQSIYGKHILTAQHSNINSTNEYENIHEITGKYPAMISVDMTSIGKGAAPFLNEPGEMQKNVGSLEMAAKWVQSHHCLLTICWHWNSPSHFHRSHSFYKRFTDFNLSTVMKEKGEDYQLLLDDMDAAAEHLKKLEDLHIPVLFRPLHEGNGVHFWWGNEPQPYLELYRTLYDRFTNQHHLNNLIWVWNAEEPQLYPGDDYVDISGLDNYIYHLGAGSLANEYHKLDFASNYQKPVALTEISTTPDMDLLKSEGIPWLWFMLWNGFPNDEKNITHEMLKEAYCNSYSLTENDLQKFIDL